MAEAFAPIDDLDEAAAGARRRWHDIRERLEQIRTRVTTKAP
ncbi:hypothetical protein [Nocardia sp. NPDC004711]